ncbi:MAG: hypothetical protein IPJ23_11025 [Ignavibacteriales bacterium]|nr:hypothetical protein [Ignavibacteriales bacterium]
MNTKTIGIIIIVIGLVMNLYTGFNYVTREKVLDIGGIEISADKNHSVSWGSFIGVGIMIIGGVVLLAGKKN